MSVLNVLSTNTVAAGATEYQVKAAPIDEEFWFLLFIFFLEIFSFAICKRVLNGSLDIIYFN